ncbi:VOC family protein [Streptomyces sp. NPDC002851]
MTESTARHKPGTPCWVSLMVHGLAGAKDFYHALFGWEFQPGPQQLGPYDRALLNGREVAGIGQLPTDRHLPIAWTTYFASDDIHVTAEHITEACGTIGVGPLDADDAGRLLIASDPTGAVFGVWQAAAHLGIALRGVPGTLAWNELVTQDTASVGKFYQSLFGYEEEAVVSADFDYLTLHIDGRPVAGIHGVGNALPHDRGPHWMTYFEVADVDRSVEQIQKLGGQLLRAPQDSAHGRMATVADPEGATFTLVHEPEGV